MIEQRVHSTSSRPSRIKRTLVVAATLFGLVVSGEVAARLVLGLGDPPLFVDDAQLEYRHKPGHYRRFGNEIFFNDNSMRSGPVTARKRNPAEYRVLVLGDSVVNGGAVLDDQQLSTTLLGRQLTRELARPVYVGNVSAGSWGPTNQAAYLEKYGWFDADLLVLVESAHDVRDASTFDHVVGVGLSYPSKKPWSALAEGYQRYWPGQFVRFVPDVLRAREEPAALVPPAPESPSAKLQRRRDEASCRLAFLEMARGARHRGTPILVALFGEKDRLQDRNDPDYRELEAIALEMKAQVLDLRPAFRRALQNGVALFRDGDVLHPSATGHLLIAEQLVGPIVALARAQQHGVAPARQAASSGAAP